MTAADLDSIAITDIAVGLGLTIVVLCVTVWALLRISDALGRRR